MDPKDNLVSTNSSRAVPLNARGQHLPQSLNERGIRGAQTKRYDVLCQRLVQEQLYTTAAVLASLRGASTTGQFAEMCELTSLKTFVTSLAGHVAAEAAR